MAEPQNAFAYQCPNCAADLKFNAQTQSFTCDYCMSQFTAAEMKEIAARQEAQHADSDADTTSAQDEFAAETGVYVCEHCGAEVMADDNTAATFCYYCHNPVLLKGRVSGKYRPSSVLPFQIPREQACTIFQTFCKKHWFLPSDFSSTAQQEKMVGLYVPFWVTDCYVRGEMDALGRRSRSWTSGNYRYTETSEFAVTRHADVTLRGIPADGASHIDDALMEAAEPFDYSKVQPFEMQYLSGFLAEKYDVNMASVFPRVQKRAVQASDQLLRASMSGYSSLSVTRSDIRVQSTDWKYMLLPVWFLTYKYRDHVYEFAVNGQSGKFVGTPPLDKKKRLLFSLGLGLAVALIAFGLGVLVR